MDPQVIPASFPPIAVPTRDDVCDRAGKELFEFAQSWKERHSLTNHEISYIVGVLAVRHHQDCVKQERVKPVPPAPPG